MKKFLIPSSFILLILLLVTSCQDFNSNTFDEFRFQSFPDTPRGNAMNLVVSKCASCHTGYHSAWSTKEYTDADTRWVSDGLVTGVGVYSDTLLVQRLFNFGGNMPQGGSSFTLEELLILQTWIDAI